jgi:c(7)-type cytochrome triheme protein
MTWATKGRKKSFYSVLLLMVLSLSSIYACVRQAKSEPVAAAEAAVDGKAAPVVVAQVTPPVQVNETNLKGSGDSSKVRSLVAPPPVEGMPQFEDPTNLPTPGPPYNRENSNPDVVMESIPKEATGVEDWVKAFKEEKISPHESLDLTKPPVPPFNFDVEIPAVGSMPNVVFPHFPHTFWLDCSNCHPGIFMMKKGGNPISMVKIVNGEFCGRCHGRVAFPIANCTRCHVKPKK